MRRLSRLAAVRRRVLILVACGLVLAGCSGGETVSPTPQTVEGTLPVSVASTVTVALIDLPFLRRLAALGRGRTSTL